MPSSLPKLADLIVGWRQFEKETEDEKTDCCERVRRPSCDNGSCADATAARADLLWATGGYPGNRKGVHDDPGWRPRRHDLDGRDRNPCSPASFHATRG